MSETSSSTLPEASRASAAPVAEPPTLAALEAHLAPYAAHASQSRGRRPPETPPAARPELPRDRDRNVPSTAFRRRVYN